MADPGCGAISVIGWPRSATRGYSGAFMRSVVFGQKTEFLHNLLPNFMQYVSE